MSDTILRKFHRPSRRRLRSNFEETSNEMIHREFNHRQFTAPNRINQRRPIPTHIYPANLTLVEILGEPKTDHSRNGHRVVPSVYGHTGCVNTLDWDTTSDRLASAGDDTK